jgi:hypothetical protein
VTPITVGTNGQLLIGQTGADPAFTTVSGDATMAANGALTLATVTVAKGGTGATTLTDHGVLVGSGTDAVTPLAAGTNGQLLIGQTGADPAFTTVSGDITIAETGVAAIGAGKVTAAMLANAVADALVVLTVTQAAEAGNKIVLSVQLKDLQGNNLASTQGFWIEVFSPTTPDASLAFSDEGAGSVQSSDLGAPRVLCLTDGTGLAEIGVTDTAAETIKLALGAGPGTPFIQGTTINLVFV